MRVVIIALVFAAVILAGGTAYLLKSYLSSQEAEIASMAPKAPTTKVLVAKSDVSAGTVINPGNTEWRDWPEDALEGDYLVKTRDADPLTSITKDKHVTRRALLKGDPITMAKLYKPDNAGFMRGSLRPGMRAIAVKSTVDSASGGFILPGDQVDVILTHNLLRRAMERTGETSEKFVALEYTSETILQDIQVLAVDQNVDELQTGAVISKTILLEVTPKQAEIVNTAKVMGTIYLALRSAEPGDVKAGTHFTTDVEVSPMLSNLKSFLSGSGTPGGMDDMSPGAPSVSFPPPAPKPIAAARPKAPPAPKKKAPQRDITIYRGDGTPPASMNLPDTAGDIAQ